MKEKTKEEKWAINYHKKMSEVKKTINPKVWEKIYK